MRLQRGPHNATCVYAKPTVCPKKCTLWSEAHFMCAAQQVKHAQMHVHVCSLCRHSGRLVSWVQHVVGAMRMLSS